VLKVAVSYYFELIDVIFVCLVIRSAVGELIADIFGSSDEEEEFEVRFASVNFITLHHHISLVTSTCTLRSSDTLLLAMTFTRTEFAKLTFRCSPPSVWNSLQSLVTNSDSLTTSNLGG